MFGLVKVNKKQPAEKKKTSLKDFFCLHVRECVTMRTAWERDTRKLGREAISQNVLSTQQCDYRIRIYSSSPSPSRTHSIDLTFKFTPFWVSFVLDWDKFRFTFRDFFLKFIVFHTVQRWLPQISVAFFSFRFFTFSDHSILFII